MLFWSLDMFSRSFFESLYIFTNSTFVDTNNPLNIIFVIVGLISLTLMVLLIWKFKLQGYYYHINVEITVLAMIWYNFYSLDTLWLTHLFPYPNKLIKEQYIQSIQLILYSNFFYNILKLCNNKENILFLEISTCGQELITIKTCTNFNNTASNRPNEQKNLKSDIQIFNDS